MWLTILWTALTPVLKNFVNSRLPSLLLKLAEKGTHALRANWRSVCACLACLLAGFLIAWLTRSPQYVERIVVEEVPRYIPRVEVVEVFRPHNCATPVVPLKKEVGTADKMIAHLNEEYRVKYLACLDSLEVY